MKILRIDSQAVRQAGYDASTKRLRIEFSSGVIYEFENISRQRCNALVGASSFGRYLNKYIVARPDRYPFKKLGKLEHDD